MGHTTLCTIVCCVLDWGPSYLPVIKHSLVSTDNSSLSNLIQCHKVKLLENWNNLLWDILFLCGQVRCVQIYIESVCTGWPLSSLSPRAWAKKAVFSLRVCNPLSPYAMQIAYLFHNNCTTLTTGDKISWSHIHFIIFSC
jgi:hypothetical protein